MIRFLIFMVLVLVAVIPSAAITRVAMKRRGVTLRLFEAPKEYMKVGPLPAKVALIAMNFAIFAGLYYAVWVLID